MELEESENYAIIYLNRPDQLNALNKKSAEELYSVFEEISKNEKIQCIIITGKGKAFCAGGDLSAFKKAKEPDKFLVNMATIYHKMITKLKKIT